MTGAPGGVAHSAPPGPSRSRCLYTLLHAPAEHHDRLLTDFVHPVVRDVGDDPRLESLFFARYNQPDWQLRFRILGEPEWIDGELRARIEAGLRSLGDRALFTGREFATYAREYARYGGPEGMTLSEQVFLHDSVACLELLEAESRGGVTRTRRELHLVWTERFLDLFPFDAGARVEFYRHGHAWAIEREWDARDLAALDTRYRSLRDGLRVLAGHDAGLTEEERWGGAEPAAVAASCLARLAPVVTRLVEAHAAGRIDQSLVSLAWSLAHMSANRLGVDAVPEAILRYFMHRLHTEPA